MTAKRLLDGMRSEPADQAIAMEFDQSIAEAIGAYRRALETVSDSSEAQVQIKAHLALGGAHRVKGSKTLFTEALGAYTQCIEHADAQPYDWFVAKLKADYCVPYQESVQQALLGLLEEEP